MRKPRRQCAPSEADWYVEVVYGQTFCREHGYLCEYAWCQRKYGTQTDYSYGFFKGDRPGNRPVKAMTPPLHYVLEVTVKRCPNEGDEAECLYCGAEITFTRGYPRWVSASTSECHEAEYGEHEPTDEFHE